MNATSTLKTAIRIAAILALLALPAVASPSRRATIIGGKGVGGFELGKKFTPYSNVLGKPTKVTQSEYSETTRFYYYRKYGMYFFVKKDVVNGIQVENPLLMTPEGIHVGSDRASVLRTYGNPQNLRAADVVYPERGLGFTFDSGRVARIVVVDKEERDLASGDMRIVPGMRVGGLQLGQRLEFVLGQWQTPEKRLPFPNKAGSELLSWRDKKGVIVISYQGKVDGIMIYSPAFRTIRDIRVGSKREEVVRAYGKPQQCEDNMESYRTSGIGFYYGDKGTVEQILVKEPGAKM